MTVSEPIKTQLRKLEEKIRYHQNLYYIQNKPEISDREFDKLFLELQDLENKYPKNISPDSPTRSIGSDLDNDFEKIKHLIPVLSLSNTYSISEALSWSSKLQGNQKQKILIQWKIDGATLVLYYKAGRLARAVTRGSGQVGDDVTANALTIRNVPHVLTKKIDLVVRGEAYMTFQDFQKFNEDFGSIYANPRNLTSGSLKHKKSREVAKRPILWAAFECHFINTSDVVPTNFIENKNAKKSIPKFKKDNEALNYLEKLGIPVAQGTTIANHNNIESAIESFTQKKENIGFPVDGLVLKLNDLETRKKLGTTAHSPRWATSLKFEPEVAETKILDVEFFTGRTGRVTPRARLEPVVLAGTTVSYATLHNEDNINKLGVRIGAIVKVSKRGEIIPAIEEVVNPGKGIKLKFPKKCPTCKSNLEREEGAADWMCLNLNCSSKILERLIFFCQRKQMDIAGMGERTCTNLYNMGILKNIADIYKLKEHRKKIEDAEGFGEKSADIILDGIETSKSQPYVRLFASLGLKDMGHSVADILIQSGFTTIDSLIGLVKKKDAIDQLQELDGIGPRTAESIVTQLKNKEVLALIKNLKKSGLIFEQKTSSKDSQELDLIFNNQVWCVTGSFESFSPRDLAKDEIKKYGGRVSGSISSKTTHLLAGQKAGSKLDKAQELGVQIIFEKEFLEMIK